MENRIICGNAKTELAKLPSEIFDLIVCSPPYFGLRSYLLDPIVWDGDPKCPHTFAADNAYHDNLRYRVGHNTSVGNNVNPDIYTHYIHRGSTKSPLASAEKGIITDLKVTSQFCSLCGAWLGNLGLEPTIDLYIDHLLQIFGECKRVLKKSGALWVNLGDSYSGSGNGANDHRTPHTKNFGNRDQYQEKYGGQKPGKSKALNKSLCLIPFYFGIAMVEDGWRMRNDITWYKRNCMPASVKDRYTVDSEHFFFFTKSDRYFFKQQFEDCITGNGEVMGIATGKRFGGDSNAKGAVSGFGDRILRNGLLGRNMRTTWDIPTTPSDFDFCHKCKTLFQGSERKRIKTIIVDEKKKRLCPVCQSTEDWVDHFAMFPKELVRRPIDACVPEFICNKCGKARKPIYSIEKINTRPGIDTLNKKSGNSGDPNYGFHTSAYSKYRQRPVVDKIEYSDCGCGEGFHAGTVCDIFGGSGTTALVAKEMDRNYVIIDASQKYCDLIDARLAKSDIVKPKRKTKAEKMAEFERKLENRQLDMFE